LTKAHVTPYGNGLCRIGLGSVALGCGMWHVALGLGLGLDWVGCARLALDWVESMWPGAWRRTTLVRCLSILFTVPRLVAQAHLRAL